MKKILYTASRATHILNFHMPYIDDYINRGFTVDVASQGELIHDSVSRYYELPFKKGIGVSWLVTAFKLAAIIRHERYDVISCHATLASMVTRMAVILSFRRCIVISTCHGYLFSDTKNIKSLLMLGVEKVLAHTTNMLIVMNRADYDIAVKHKLCRRIELINGMGLDTSKLNKAKKNLTNTFTFLCVGEFSKRKNQRLLLEAFARMCSTMLHDVRMLFAGEGEQLDECRQLCQQLNLTEKVVFLGYVRDIDRLYNSAHCVISASKSEGLPFNIMEALYYGVPVIATDVKGHRDLISDGINGFLFNIDDTNQLEALMRRIVRDEACYATLKQGAVLNDKYVLNSVFGHLKDLYMSVE